MAIDGVFAQRSFLVIVGFCILMFAMVSAFGAGIDLGAVNSSATATFRAGTESPNAPAKVDVSTYQHLSAIDKTLADSDSKLAQAAADVKEASNR